MRRFLSLALVLVVVVPATAHAGSESEVGFRGWGPRVGLTVDPDQIHLGAHVDFGNFARHVRFQPNLEVGFGVVTLFALNFEAAYRFQSRWNVWTPYVGGGLGLNFVRGDLGHRWLGSHHFHDNTGAQAGLNILGGIEKGLRNGDRFFAEAKLGFSNSPDLKLTVGWTFFH